MTRTDRRSSGLDLVVSDEAMRAAQSFPRKDERRFYRAIFDLRKNPESKGLRFKKLKGYDRVYSARVSQSVRLVLHRRGSTYRVVHVCKRDSVYDWTDRHRFEYDPDEGFRVVSIPTVEGSPDEPSHQPHPHYDKKETYQPPLFQNVEDDYLVSLGVPEDWLPTIRDLRTMEDLVEIVDRLESGVAEALFKVAQGERVTPPRRRSKFHHVEENILDYIDEPLSAWMIYLHPRQRDVAESSFDGPVRVTGSAGTGKTAAALHRARHLAQRGRQVLVASFGRTLCDDLRELLERLCVAGELARIEVATVHAVALRLVREIEPEARPVENGEIEELLRNRVEAQEASLDPAWLLSEWRNVVQPRGVESEDGYLGAPRESRGTSLDGDERRAVWDILGEVRGELRSEQAYDWPDLARRARELLEAGEVDAPWDAVVVDEAQDLRTQEVRLVHAIGGDGPDGLSLFGDAGQRIYRGGFSLADLGIDVEDRAIPLRVTYRMTREIRRFADDILARGNHGDDDRGMLRQLTRSLVSGPPPVVRGYEDLEGQTTHVVEKVRALIEDGVRLDEMAIFARSNGRLDPFQDALESRGYETHRLSPTEGRSAASGIKLATMHRAKGLEFKVVFVVQVDAEAIPNQTALESQADSADRADVLRRERKLLYVACTRARDELHLTWSGEPSPFLPGTDEGSDD